MYQNQYRIHQDILLEINSAKRFTNDYFVLKDTPSKFIQHIPIDSNLIGGTVFYNSHKINSSWLNSQLLSDSLNLVREEIKQIEIKLKLRQGFDWSNTRGFVFVLKDKNSDLIYCSHYFTSNDFIFKSGVELINNNYWSESVAIIIPDILNNIDNISFAIETVTFGDLNVDTDGYYDVLNYPNQFETLILDEPLSDKLNVSLEWTDNLFLKIKPVSLIREFTFDQLFKWNFSIDNLDTLEVKHLIKFQSDTNGNFTELVASNNINPTGEIIIGLPLIYTQEKQLIEVTTYFIVNGKIATRYNNIVYDYISNKIGNLPSPSLTLKPINVTENININNNVINTVIKTKVIKVPQPKFIELITNHQIKIDNKNIMFEEVEDFKTYMGVFFNPKLGIDESPNTIIFAEKTELNKYFYDLSKINAKMNEDNLTEVEFKLFNFEDSKLILSGKFIK